MTEWLLQFDRKIGLQNRKVLLFLDNAASHPVNLKLKNIKIIFLPPNTTSHCQPLDQGIIKNFKTFYRALILKHLLSKMDNLHSVNELSKSIDLLDVVYFVKNAWDQVSSTTIKNCFRKSGFQNSELHETQCEFDAEDELPLILVAQINKCLQNTATNISLEEFITIDNKITTEDDNIDFSLNLDEETVASEEDENEEIEEIGDINTFHDALKANEDLKKIMILRYLH